MRDSPTDAHAGPPAPPATRFRVGDVEVVPETGAVTGPRGQAKLDPKVMDVLACLAAAGGGLVGRDQIMASVWRDVVVTDYALSRCIYQLRKALSRVSAAETSPIETLPRRGYRLVWEVTDGESTVDVVEPATPARRARHIAATVLLVAIAALVGRQFLDLTKPGRPGADHGLRVSVLPLEDLSADGSQAVFARGLSREIMHQIARIPGVVAIGRTSVFELVNAGLPGLDTARRMDADLIISGTVAPAGESRRILLDLRSVSTGELLWSRSYLIVRDAPFVMLPELGHSVAQILDFSTSHEERPGATRDLTAFEVYLDSGEAASYAIKRQLLERAVELDPAFAAAWAKLAGIEVYQVWTGQVPLEEAWRRAEPCLDRAFELDPDLPAAFVTQGRFRREFGDMDGAIASFERALELDPGNAEASANLGLVLRFTGRYDEALAVHEMSVAMDPLSSNAQTRLGTSYWFTGNFELAARHYQIALDLDPSNEEIYDSWSGMLGAGLGRFDEALTMIERKMSLPGEPTVRTLAFAGNLSSLLGMDAAALDYWERGRSANPDYLTNYHGLLQHHLARRDDEAARRVALALLERSPRDTSALLALAVLDFERGRGEAFAGRMRAAYPEWFVDLAGIDRTEADVALLVALAYAAEGTGGQQERVLEAIEAAIDGPRASEHLLLAAAYAMHDRPEMAIRALRSSPPGRVRLLSAVMLRDPRFASLRDHADFRALVAGHIEALRRQGMERSARLAAH